MVDFGDELTIDTFKIPWLIWIQILVLLLLLVLLYCFSIFPLEPPHIIFSPHSSSSSSSSSSGPSKLSHQSLSTNKPPLLIKRSSQPSQVGGSQSLKGEIQTSTIRRGVVASGEEVTHERESSASSTSTINYHPCHYFKLARLAFLKCLGLDSSENPSSHEQRKER